MIFNGLIKPSSTPDKKEKCVLRKLIFLIFILPKFDLLLYFFSSTHIGGFIDVLLYNLFNLITYLLKNVDFYQFIKGIIFFYKIIVNINAIKD